MENLCIGDGDGDGEDDDLVVDYVDVDGVGLDDLVMDAFDQFNDDIDKIMDSIKRDEADTHANNVRHKYIDAWTQKDIMYFVYYKSLPPENRDLFSWQQLYDSGINGKILLDLLDDQKGYDRLLPGVDKTQLMEIKEQLHDVIAPDMDDYEQSADADDKVPVDDEETDNQDSVYTESCDQQSETTEGSVSPPRYDYAHSLPDFNRMQPIPGTRSETVALRPKLTLLPPAVPDSGCGSYCSSLHVPPARWSPSETCCPVNVEQEPTQILLDLKSTQADVGSTYEVASSTTSGACSQTSADVFNFPVKSPLQVDSASPLSPVNTPFNKFPAVAARVRTSSVSSAPCQPVARRRGRPRKYPPGCSKPAKEKNPSIGPWVLDLLEQGQHSSVIEWANPERDDGVFRIVHSKMLSRMWGDAKCNRNKEMSHEKLSRAIRERKGKEFDHLPTDNDYPKKLHYAFKMSWLKGPKGSHSATNPEGTATPTSVCMSASSPATLSAQPPNASAQALPTSPPTPGEYSPLANQFLPNQNPGPLSPLSCNSLTEGSAKSVTDSEVDDLLNSADLPMPLVAGIPMNGQQQNVHEQYTYGKLLPLVFSAPHIELLDGNNNGGFPLSYNT